jgi:hypothetical protein
MKIILWDLMPYSPLYKEYIVACLLKARIVKPAETAVAREWLHKHAHCSQQLLKHAAVPEPSLSIMPVQQ